MAFHVECNEQAVSDPRYKKLESKYPGECSAGGDCKCGGKITIGQKIWYWTKESGGSNSSGSSSNDLDAYKRALAECQLKIRKLEEEIFGWISFSASIKDIDWSKMPRRDKAKAVPTTDEAADIFEGSEITFQ